MQEKVCGKPNGFRWFDYRVQASAFEIKDDGVEPSNG
jgi:hypothetical protein